VEEWKSKTASVETKKSCFVFIKLSVYPGSERQFAHCLVKNMPQVGFSVSLNQPSPLLLHAVYMSPNTANPYATIPKTARYQKIGLSPSGMLLR
jgi:hypothetical protein